MKALTEARPVVSRRRTASVFGKGFVPKTEGKRDKATV
jgi:hypothetical protein